ncbi:MAG TPA: hypothetical protein VLE19_13490, partial [Pyrinomonadaceae bacterium]|nr:hypothetical protein [Pyrinomonadaceae bacterium]
GFSLWSFNFTATAKADKIARVVVKLKLLEAKACGVFTNFNELREKLLHRLKLWCLEWEVRNGGSSEVKN